MIGRKEIALELANQIVPAQQLLVMDPELALEMENAFAGQQQSVSPSIKHLILTDTVWGLANERALGQAIAQGYLTLLEKVPVEKLVKYHELMRATHEAGPSMGRSMAFALLPILLHTDNEFLNHFLETKAIMLTKGSYTLSAALDTLDFLLKTADVDGAWAFLALLKTIFNQPLSYNRSRHLAQIISKRVRSFPFCKRVFQIQSLDRLAQVDVGLLEGFLESFDRGLGRLDAQALSIFMAKGLDKLSHSRESGEKFLFMSSIQARNFCRDLQVTATFLQVRSRLNRYLQARTGLPLAVKPLSTMVDADWPFHRPDITVLSDGKFICLPDEIHMASTWQGNEQIYQVLVRLEAAYYECGTHYFDIEKCSANGWLPQASIKPEPQDAEVCDPDDSIADMEKFWGLFDHFQLAADLFLIFEHGRIRQWLKRHYPGVLRKTLPILQQEAEQMAALGKTKNPLLGLYQVLALGKEVAAESVSGEANFRLNARAVKTFYETVVADSGVEVGALLVTKLYPEFAALYPEKDYEPMVVPFGRRIRPDLFQKSFHQYHQTAKQIQKILSRKNIQIFRGDIRKKLCAQQGRLSKEDLRSLVIMPPGEKSDPNPDEVCRIERGITTLDFTGILDGNAGIHFHTTGNGDDGWAFRYKEWDFRLQEYLDEHVLVREKPANPAESDFFDSVRSRHPGLLKRIRYSFEMLKPQGLTLLRQWVEGDGFDYRALIDYFIDRKSGIMPSDRLYIKRLKQVRDVCVLLLVDLSRSTANPVVGGQVTVLDIEKEAIVLLCEALAVVGDRFAIAGFSGSGRLGVEYFIIKKFDEPIGENVRLRINGMLPQRSTRMGAAIRHAASQLAQMESRVRLLLILGDGFPNDSGYKQEYAIEDTRRALFEARGMHIHTHGITVNMATDARMDDIFGKSRHHMISDVRELPDKLFRIYGALTRQSM